MRFAAIERRCTRVRMKIRDKSDETIFGVEVDLAKPPPMVKRPDQNGALMSLDWDRALDDNRRLRRCPVCGCPDLFVRKQVPQLTLFAAPIVAAIVAMVLYGFGMLWPALAVLAVVVLVDLGIFLYIPRVLECYRCHTQFRGMPISHRHPRWEKGLADRYANEAAQSREARQARQREAVRDSA